MLKKRAGFIIATYEGENFDWGLLSAEALRDQLYGGTTEGENDEDHLCPMVVGFVSTVEFGKPVG